MGPLKLAFLLFALGACSTATRLSEDYRASIEGQSNSSSRSTLFILVDGLSYDLLRSELKAGSLPQLQQHFLSGVGSGLHEGRSVFPTLTYPNIVSFLSGLAPDEHGVLGNKVRLGGEDYNFENPVAIERLNQLLKGRSIFSRLKAAKQNSVSLSVYFREGSSAHAPRTLDGALAYVSKDYAFGDKHSLRSLQKLLDQNASNRLPAFIFLHLVGLDGTSHDKGPNAEESVEYLRWLDGELAPLLARVRQIEQSGYPFVTVLGSDHGFVEAGEFLDLQKWLAARAPRALSINDGRIATLFLPGYDARARQLLSVQLTHEKAVATMAWRDGNLLNLWVKEKHYQFEYGNGRCPQGDVTLRNLSSAGAGPWLCSSELGRASGAPQPENLVPSVATYFHAFERPDALLIAAEGWSFRDKFKGEHGGLSQKETRTPVLLRGARLKGRGLVPHERLLDFVTK